MKIQRFDGGQSSRLEPQLIGQNQGVVYENINNALGILSPEQDKLPTGINTKQYVKWYNKGKEWISSSTPTDYLEFQQVLYIADRINRPQKYSAGTYNLLGIEAPEAKVDLVNTSQAKPLEELTAIVDNTAGSMPSSDFDYFLFNIKDGIYSSGFQFTVFNSTTGIQKAEGSIKQIDATVDTEGNPITTVATANNRQITFSDLRGEFGDSAELYRRYKGKWYLVDTFATETDSFSDSIEDISGNTELDEDLISVFNGTYQYVYTYYNANDGTESAPSPLSDEIEVTSGTITVINLVASTDPQVTHIRLYRVGNNIVQFTLVEQLAASTTSYEDTLSDSEVDGRQLVTDNYTTPPAGLKYLTESYSMLFGVDGTNLRFTPIGQPNVWPEEYSLQFEDLITGLGPVSNGLLVMTRFKTHIVTGTGPLSLAKQLLRGDQGCIAFESVQQTDKGTLIWASEDGLCTSSGNNVVNFTKPLLGKIVLSPVSSAVLDEVYYCQDLSGKILSWDYRFTPIAKYLTLNTRALAVAENTLYGWSNGELFELFEGTNKLSFTYKSPRFIEGTFTETKTYKKVYVRSEGDIIIKILINDVIVATRTLSTKDTHVIQVPQDEQRGYSIQFEITGTGKIQEMEYVVGRRQQNA